MTDEEIVERAKEAEKRTGFGELVHSPISKGVNSAYGIGFIEGMVEYRNSLQEELVSEELEDFAKRQADEFAEREYEVDSYDRGYLSKGYYWGFKAGTKWQAEQFEKNRLAHCDALTEEQAQIESDFVTKHLKENSRTPTFIDAIEYGIKMQEEQMMAKAINGEVTYGKSLAIPSLGWVLDKEGLDYGDRVKLIIIKED